MYSIVIPRALVAALTLVLAGLAAGCGSDDSGPIKIKGQIALGEDDAAVEADDSAHISLVQQDADDAQNERIVAERTLHGLGHMPVAFALVVGRGLLDPTGRYALSAQILSPEGEVIWQTGSPQTLDVFDQKTPARLALLPLRTSPDGPFADFACQDGFEFQLAHDHHGATVRLGRRQISLHRGKSLTPDSRRYVDAHNDEIVMAHGTASIYFDGVSHHGCKPAAQTQPGAASGAAS